MPGAGSLLAPTVVVPQQIDLAAEARQIAQVTLASPISLLPLQAKILAAVLAHRLQGTAFLEQIPQFAYVSGRTLTQALERVIGHCASVRRLVQENTKNIHGKRLGKSNLRIYGDCHLSLDVSCACDHVPWPELRLALEAARVDNNLIEAILLVHRTAKLHVSHCGMSQGVSLKRGLRQGCGLSPLLWAVFCGWILQNMHDPQLLNVPEVNTSYADDLHYGSTILDGRSLEKAYAAMKHILAFLTRRGLTISQDKTVVVLELQGPYADKALERYTIRKPTGQYFRFQLETQTMYIKVVSHHVFLGAVIGFRRFEQDTFRHRLAIAGGSFSRLSVVLRSHTIPVRLRLQLWQGCVWPALLHALDCTGLPLKELQALQTQLLKQARSIAKSHSMLTKETNVEFINRLKLPNPVRCLQRALANRCALDTPLCPALTPGDAQMQWRAILRGHLFDGAGVWHASPVTLNPSAQSPPSADHISLA